MTSLTRILVAAAVVLSTGHALAWTNVDYTHTNKTWDPSLLPGIKVRFASPSQANSVGFTARQKEIVRAVIQQFNSLPNAAIYLYEAEENDTCVGEREQNGGAAQPNGTICIMNKLNAGSLGGTHNFGGSTIKRCETELASAWVADDRTLWKTLSHELGHCMGLGHANVKSDWMEDLIGLNDTKEHMGMTRDTRNGLSYKYPFSQSFFFGEFDGWSGANILLRDNSNGDTVSWYSVDQNVHGAPEDFDWNLDADSQVMDDFGNATTLAYVQGDFNGDGMTDMARGHCPNCKPADGAADTVQWGVRLARRGEPWGPLSTWLGDFGDGEDYDQFRAGDFNGDHCDDLWLIRDKGDPTCSADPNAANACKVEVWVANSHNGSDSHCDRFDAPVLRQTLKVAERSAATAWPWLIGNFVPDSIGCLDMAYGRTDQVDPMIMSWTVLESADTDASGLCDTLRPYNNGATWAADFGGLGDSYFMAADMGGHGVETDLVLVRPRVGPGLKRATWYVAYNDGHGGFEPAVTIVNDNWITGAEKDWTAKVFGIGTFVSGGSDIISLIGQDPLDWLQARVRIRGDIFNSTWTTSVEHQGPVPVGTDIPRVGGKAVRDAWWCEDCTRYR